MIIIIKDGSESLLVTFQFSSQQVKSVYVGQGNNLGDFLAVNLFQQPYSYQTVSLYYMLLFKTCELMSLHRDCNQIYEVMSSMVSSCTL